MKTTFGELVWQGWDDAEIPVIIWNYSYEFLLNYTDQLPPNGLLHEPMI